MKIGRTLGAVAIILIGSINVSHAELTFVDQIGNWQLMKDSDPIFGPLGYQLVTSSTNDNGKANLALRCYFDTENIITTSIVLSSTAVDFTKFERGRMAHMLNSLLRYDSDEIRQGEWIRTEEASRVGYSSGGSNVDGDYRNSVFQEAVRRARASNARGLGRILDGDGLAGGIEMFFWNMSVKEQLAIGFGSGDTRTSMLFDLSGGAQGVDRLLDDCHEEARGTQPEDTRSPRERTTWRGSVNAAGQYMWFGIDAGQCIEFHAVRYRRGHPMTIDDLVAPGQYKRTVAESGTAIFEGPKERLEVFFGENSSEGSFNHRVWRKEAASCDQD